MESKINLTMALSHISEHFSPQIIGEIDDVYIKLVKILGDRVPWHSHKNEDELFLILEGSLVMEVENKVPFQMNKGDLYIVAKGTEHKVWSHDECHVNRK